MKLPPAHRMMYLLGMVLVAGEATAQKTATAPEPMPFDVPYGVSITASEAEALVRAVVAKANKPERNWKLAVAVTDSGGELVYFYKMDQTQVASIGVAINKARTSARFRRPTEAFARAMQDPGGVVVPTLEPSLVASPGGIPIVRGGKIIGAIGCSGATSAQDAIACGAILNVEGQD